MFNTALSPELEALMNTSGVDCIPPIPGATEIVRVIEDPFGSDIKPSTPAEASQEKAKPPYLNMFSDIFEVHPCPFCNRPPEGITEKPNGTGSCIAQILCLCGAYGAKFSYYIDDWGPVPSIIVDRARVVADWNQKKVYRVQLYGEVID